MRRALQLAAAAVLFSVAGSAFADGVVVATADVPAAARAELAAAIAAFRPAHAATFAAVRAPDGIDRAVYGKRQNPRPAVDVELRRLGPDALLPMLDALAFDGPARGAHDDAEWTAYAVGLLDAVGALRDPRSTPVLRAAFDPRRAPEVASAAARALGRLCDDAAAATLLARAKDGDALRDAAVEGLGQCRRKDAADRLVALLAAAPDDAAAARVARALGVLGSSWAWKALGANARGAAIRASAAAALVTAFAKRRGEARDAAGHALGLVDHPDTPGLVAAARASADAETAAALDALAAQLPR